MEWLSEIRKLRKNVPVGIQVARRLLGLAVMLMKPSSCFILTKSIY